MWNWIEVSRDALVQNVRTFQKLLGHKAAVFVLKSNAYGHGLVETYEAIKGETLPILCTQYLSEAVKLRELGFTGRLLIVGPFVPEDMASAAARQIEMFLGHSEGLQAWLSAPAKPRLHIEFDTGMSRQGFLPSEAAGVASDLEPHKESVAGVCMHFANVEDVTEHSYADTQLERFESSKREFTSRGFTVEAHAASSASALILDSSRFDLCRVGISLYGFWPSLATKISYSQLHGKADMLELKPALSWRSRITSINQVAAGQYIGYGCTFRARKNMQIGILPVGYFEGYPRIASGSPAYVLIKGERCPIVGRICMNMMMVDMTDLSGVSVGDSATLIGHDGRETITASEVAAWSQTIHYELVTRLNSDIPRRIVG